MSKKAVLISGPPGIGKTTAAMIVSRELGFEPVEVNASDARGKADSDVNKGVAVRPFGCSSSGWRPSPCAVWSRAAQNRTRARLDAGQDLQHRQGAHDQHGL